MRKKKNVGRQKQYHREFIRVVQNLANEQSLLDLFLRDILTPKEYDELALRWQIVQRLDRDVTQRDIVRELGVAIATVTRGARVLQDPNGGLNQVLRRHLNKT